MNFLVNNKNTNYKPQLKKSKTNLHSCIEKHLNSFKTQRLMQNWLMCNIVAFILLIF